MYTINVDVGKNIEKVAKDSGAPGFGVEAYWGAKFYEIVGMPADIPVRYIRPGYEITAQPLFSLTMFADTENNNDLAVEKITFQFSRHAAKTHGEARALVEGLIAQFRNGKWHRHIENTCPAVTGRSAYLNLDEKIRASCFLDPEYKMSMEDWRELAKLTLQYAWLGEGVLAKLSVNFDEAVVGSSYLIGLEFQDFAIQNRRYFAQEALELVEGDKKGWNSTAKHKKDMADIINKVKRLEENAVKRGDSIVARDQKM